MKYYTFTYYSHTLLAFLCLIQYRREHHTVEEERPMMAALACLEEQRGLTRGRMSDPLCSSSACLS